jgi:RNA polymerase sigma-70 factor, ECF subfamily
VTSDEDLVDLIQGGDEAAFTQLVGRYHNRFVRLAQSVVGSHPIAEEVAQETWLAVLRGLPQFERRSSLQTWMFRICVNRARSSGGREHRTVPIDTGGPTVDPARFSTDGAWAAPPEDWTDAVDDRMVASGLIPHVSAAIDDLPELQRQVVTLRDIEGLSSNDVCDVLSITAANERVLLHRGRSRVRSSLETRLKDR